MTIQEIMSIMTIIEEKSINKAAAKLYISQPALSKCIKRVEQEYGITLFERSKGTALNLTPEGQCFSEMAESVLKSHQIFEQQLAQVRLQSNNSILFATTLQRAQTLSSPLMGYIFNKYPQYYVDIKTYPSKDLLSALKAGVADILLMVDDRYPQEGLYSREVLRAKSYIYLRAGSDLGKQAQQVDGRTFPVLSLKALEGEPVVCNVEGTSSRRYQDEMMQRTGTHVQNVEQPNHALRMAMVDAGYADAIIPDDAVFSDGSAIDRTRLYSIPDEEQEPHGRYLVCKTGFREDPRYEMVYEALMDHFTNLKKIHPAW